MARYILIDLNTGYIFGDTADFAAGRQSDTASITDAARLLDESIGEYGRTYEIGARSDIRGGATGYIVYRADINGSEALPIEYDGQDQEIIDAVARDCQYEGVVLCGRPE